MNYLIVALLAVPCLGMVAPRASPTTDTLSPWVTIDYEGNAHTITPTVDGTSTVSAPPSSLTSTSEYVLSINGQKKTKHAAPPVATASSGTMGAFMLCESHDYSSLTNAGPFCQPQTGSQLTPNTTYYITWDPVYFAALGLQDVELETQDAVTGRGFVTGILEASSGVYAWTINENYLEEQSLATANVSFYIAFNRTSLTAAGGKKLVRMQGPSVIVTNTPATVQHHAVPVAVIVVPVVIGVTVLAAMAFCVWSYRHHGRLPCIGGIVSKRTSSFSAQGYNVSERPSYGQQTGSFGIKGQPIQPVRSSSGNVFRDELKRQEEQM